MGPAGPCEGAYPTWRGEDGEGFMEDVVSELNPEVIRSFLRERTVREKRLFLLKRCLF